MAPQLIVLFLMVLAIGLSMGQHGNAKTGNHNLLTDIISNGITFGLLWWGGFFKILFERG
jgi:hypothetical protein